MKGKFCIARQYAESLKNISSEIVVKTSDDSCPHYAVHTRKKQVIERKFLRRSLYVKGWLLEHNFCTILRASAAVLQ